jgi:threonine synthase
METCSFKELEALAVTARSAAWADRTLVVASAGNTTRGSAHLLAAAPSDLQSIPERVARLAERRAA